MLIDDLLKDSRLLDLEGDLGLDNGDVVDLSWEGSSFAKKRRTHRKAPEAPKRFKSAYICYVMEKMDQMKQSAGPDVKVTELMKTLAIMWKNLPEAERSKYENIAEADKMRYFQELSTYTGPMQVPNKRRKKDPFAPKRAMSAFLSYSKEMRSKIREEMPGLKNSEISVVLAQRWRAASEAEKRPHLEKEKRDRQQYYEDLAVWRAAEAERVKLEEDERRRQSTRETVEFLNLPEQLRCSSGDSSSKDRDGSPSGSKAGSAASGTGSRADSSGGSSGGSSAGHSQDGGSDTASNPADGDGWQQVTRKKKSNKHKKKKSSESSQATGQGEGRGGDQGKGRSHHRSGYQDSSRPQLQAWRAGPESQAMTRSSSASAVSGGGGSEETRDIPEVARGLTHGAAERASRDAIAAAASAGHSDAPRTSHSKSSGSSLSSGGGSTGSTTAASASIGSTDSRMCRSLSTKPGAVEGRKRDRGDNRSCGGSDGATDSAPGSNSPVSSDSGSKGGLSDTVHEGLTAFVSYMDGTGAGPEPAHRGTADGIAYGALGSVTRSPSPRPPGTAHFTHSWRQKTGQLPVGGGGSRQPVWAGSAEPATASGSGFWDTMMTHQWFSQPGMSEQGHHRGAVAGSVRAATAAPAASAAATVCPSEMHTLRTLHSVHCAGLYDDLLPLSRGGHCDLAHRGAEGRARCTAGTGAAAVAGGGCGSEAVSVAAPRASAGPAVTFANALPPGWH